MAKGKHVERKIQNKQNNFSKGKEGKTKKKNFSPRNIKLNYLFLGDFFLS